MTYRRGKIRSIPYYQNWLKGSALRAMPTLATLKTPIYLVNQQRNQLGGWGEKTQSCGSTQNPLKYTKLQNHNLKRRDIVVCIYKLPLWFRLSAYIPRRGYMHVSQCMCSGWYRPSARRVCFTGRGWSTLDERWAPNDNKKNLLVRTTRKLDTAKPYHPQSASDTTTSTFHITARSCVRNDCCQSSLILSRPDSLTRLCQSTSGAG